MDQVCQYNFKVILFTYTNNDDDDDDDDDYNDNNDDDNNIIIIIIIIIIISVSVNDNSYLSQSKVKFSNR